MRPTSNQPKSVFRRAQEGINVREELVRLDVLLEQLKVEYERFFLGISQHPPDTLHNEVKRQMRLLAKAPSKSSQMNYTFRTLQSRYHSYNNYWARTNRERDAGTYYRDVFKANLRERQLREDAEAMSAKGQVKKGFEVLYQSYCSALEKQTGAKQDVDFDRFQKALMQRAKQFREQHGKQKLTFKVVVKEGKVSVQARAKKATRAEPIAQAAAERGEERRSPVRRGVASVAS